MVRAANTLCWEGWTFIPGPLAFVFLLMVSLNSAWVQAAHKTGPIPSHQKDGGIFKGEPWILVSAWEGDFKNAGGKFFSRGELGRKAAAVLALITPFPLGVQAGSSLRFEGVLWVRPHSEQGLAVAPEGKKVLLGGKGIRWRWSKMRFLSERDSACVSSD